MPLLNIRPAEPEDLPQIVAAADAVFRSPRRPGLGSMGHDYPLLFAAENAGNLLIGTSSSGQLVAHAGFTLRPAALGERRAVVACFGAVFTSEGHRQQGLATQVFAAAVARARAAGAQLGLVSGRRELYRRAGFEPYPLCRGYRVPAGAPAAASGLVLRPLDQAGRAVLARLGELLDREPVRFLRTPEDWRRLAAAGVVFYEPGTIYLVEIHAGGAGAGSIVAAYLAVTRPPAEGDGPRRARVLEIGGDRTALADALPALARALGHLELEVVVPPHERGLEAAALARGWVADEVRLGCSAQIWNPELAASPLPFYGLDYV